MQEFMKLIAGVVFLALAFPIGDFLATLTSDELKKGEFWFRIIVFCGLIGGFIGLLIENDFLMFSLFFIALVTSRSLKRKQ